MALITRRVAAASLVAGLSAFPGCSGGLTASETQVLMDWEKRCNKDDAAACRSVAELLLHNPDWRSRGEQYAVKSCNLGDLDGCELARDLAPRFSADRDALEKRITEIESARALSERAAAREGADARAASAREQPDVGIHKPGWPGCSRYLEDRTCNQSCWQSLLLLDSMYNDCSAESMRPSKRGKRDGSFVHRSGSEERPTVALSADPSSFSDPFLAGCKTECAGLYSSEPSHTRREAMARCEYERGEKHPDCAAADARAEREREASVRKCPANCMDRRWYRSHELASKFIRESTALERCRSAHVVGDCFPVLAYLRSCEHAAQLSGKRPTCPEYEALAALRDEKQREFARH